MLIDNVNDFTFASPSTSAVLTGVSSNLTIWKVGDRVAVNSIPFGIPSNLGLAFGSGVMALNGNSFVGNDLFGTYGGGSGANFATLTAAPAESAVPEPATYRLFGSGAFLLAVGSRFLRKRRS